MPEAIGKPPWVVEVRRVTKTYGEGDVAVQSVRGIDLQVPQGQLVAIMGPSGSGKSTLLCILGGIESPSTGQVLLEGKDLALLDDDARTLLRRRRLGFVFQTFNLLPTLSALENVSLPLELDGVDAGQARERALRMLQMVEVGHRGNHLPGQMSGGEQQRVAIARALAIEPALVLADEPTGNLDSKNSSLITRLLRRLVDEHQQTIILVTHDPAVASQADRIVHLRDGLVVDGEEAALLLQPVGRTNGQGGG